MIRNLWYGLKLALLLKCDGGKFRISYGSLWFIFAMDCLAAAGIDYFNTTHPVLFNAGGFSPLTLDLVLFLLMSFVISLLFRDSAFTLALPVVMLNALFFPNVIGRLLYWTLYWPQVYNHRILSDCSWLLWCWNLLVLFNCLTLFTGTRALRQVASVALLMAVLYIPQKYIYNDPFWDTDYEATRKAEATVPPPSWVAPSWLRELVQKHYLWAEDILPQQEELLRKELSDLGPHHKGRNTYVTLFGGFGSQRVFMNEVLYVKSALAEKLHTGDHTVILVNNPATLTHYPLATIVNLRETLQALGHKANPAQDLLLMYITSHGVPGGSVSVELPNVALKQLDTNLLKSLLKESGFKWKVIIISACYSGMFIEPLKDDNTVIITAARKDRTSFGCGDESEFTYFGDAYFKQALPKAAGLIPAFDAARKIISKMEDDQHSEPHSEPQIYVGSAIRQYLEANEAR